MINVLILIGSPRKNGNSSIMADAIAEKVGDGKVNLKKFYLYDYEIKPCIDCRACKKNELQCVIEDGMKNLYPEIDDADALIIATPIYWFGPTAKTKLMLDRLRPYFVNKKLMGKKAALLLPAGSGEGDCDLTIEMFNRSFDALGLEYLGAVTAEAYDAGDVRNDSAAMMGIADLSRKIFAI